MIFSNPYGEAKALGLFGSIRRKKDINMPDNNNPLGALGQKLGFDFSVGLPGESIIKAALELAATNRATMSQANRDGFDALALAVSRNIHNAWVSGWGALGIPGEKV